MRETSSLASAHRHQQLPTSLMQRLEMTEHLARQALAQADLPPAHGRVAGRGSGRRAHAIVLAWFSLGVLASCAMGTGTVVGLRALAAGGTPPAWAAVASAIARWVRVPSAQSAPQADAKASAGSQTAEVILDRSTKAPVPLALAVTGPENLPIEIVVSGVPTGVRLSHGAPLGPSTWALSRADLDGLDLLLDDTAPQAFDLSIGVRAPTGVATAGSVVQVRLAASTPVQQAVARDELPPEPPATGKVVDTTDVPELASAEMLPAAPVAPPVARRDPPRAETAPVNKTGPAPPAKMDWPEGAMGLGAVPH
jgi:hypothetical protein